MLIFLVGAGSLAFYQILTMEDRLEDMTQTVDQMDVKVKRAQYEKGKFFAIARDVLRLVPKDPKAERVAADFKLQQLQTEAPELLALSTTPDTTTNGAPAQPAAATNSAPVQPSEATNTAPLNSASPTAR
jgi:TolA-binding protein